MGRKDVFFLALLASALAAIAAPALIDPGAVFGNFGDIYAYHYPLQHLTAAGLQSGRLPFWNPYVFSGIPLLANSQAAVFYPPAALLRVLPLGYALTLYITGHLGLAALGTYLLLRASRLDAGMSCLFAAAYSLGSFLVYRVPQGIPTHIAALAYVPWCWLALGSRRAGFLGAVWALELLSGHPQFALINASGMALAAALSRGRFELGKIMLREGLIAGALCLVQMAPMAEFIGRSNRGALPSEFSAAYSLPPRALWTLLWPAFAWDPLRGNFGSVPSVFFESYAAYIGWTPLALAVSGLALKLRATGRMKAPASAPGLCLSPNVMTGFALAAMGIFLALGNNNPLLGALRDAPIAGLSRTPARYVLLVVWGLIWSGAAAWRDLTPKFRTPGIKAALLAFTFLDLGLWAGRFVYAEDPKPYLAPNPGMVAALAGRPVRFASGTDLANPNKAMLYRAQNVNGYDAFYLDSYTRYAARSEGGPAGDPSRTYIRKGDSPEMRRLGVAYYATREDRPGPAIGLGGGVRLYPVDGAAELVRSVSGHPEAPATQDVAWSAVSPERWTVRGRASVNPGARRLVLSVPHYPGWQAWLNGAPAEIQPEDGLVQAVNLSGLEAGSVYRVDFRFQPTFWPALCLASGAAWLLWWAQCARPA